MPQVVENSEGQTLNLSDCELLAFTKIPAEVRARESELFGLKWFDYRALHPVRATYLFAETYERVIRTMYAEQKDRDKADAAVVFFPTDIFKNRELLGCVNARQAYDRLGIRYDFAITFALRRNMDRGWRVFARPNQIYEETMLLDMVDAWKIELGARLQLPTSPRFKTENFTNHPDQLAWEQYAIAQAKRREFPERALSTFFHHDLLRPAAAAQEFPANVVREAERYAKLLSG